MTTYTGHIEPDGSRSVTVTDEDGTRLLPPRLDAANHGPMGFAWGYNGSGPSQLALALLCDAADVDRARQHYAGFQHYVIDRLTRNEGWTIEREDVLAWLVWLERKAALEADGGTSPTGWGQVEA